MAELLAVGDPDTALGAESVPGLRMQQKTSAYLTIPLALSVFGLTMRALGHIILHVAALGYCSRQAHETAKPLRSQYLFIISKPCLRWGSWPETSDSFFGLISAAHRVEE
jgi:hypothetical protein